MSTASQYAGREPIPRIVSACRPGLPGARLRTAAEVLAAMLDLQGSVRLAHGLDASSARNAVDAEVAERAPLLLGDYVRKRLAAIGDALERRLAQPYDGPRARVEGPSAFFVSLESSGALVSADAARFFAEATWRDYRDHLLASVDRARVEVIDLRDEIASDLRDAGRRGAALESVDATVRAALKSAVPALCARLATAMEGPFVDALVAAIAVLPTPLARESIDPWFAPRGVLGAQLAQTREVTLALFARDARTLEALVDAVYGEAAT